MSLQADIEADLPPLQHATITIPESRVATLFSSPYTLVPGQTGKILKFTHLYVRKRAGVAWTTSGSGTLKLTYTVTPFSTEANIFDQSTTTTFFGAAEAVWVAEAGGGQFNAIGTTTGTNACNGAGLRLSLASADISGGTGSLTVDLWYRAWPGL